MRYKEVLNEYVGKKGTIMSGESFGGTILNMTSTKVSQHIATIIEVGEDYILLETASGKEYSPISKFSLIV